MKIDQISYAFLLDDTIKIFFYISVSNSPLPQHMVRAERKIKVCVGLRRDMVPCSSVPFPACFTLPIAQESLKRLKFLFERSETPIVSAPGP